MEVRTWLMTCSFLLGFSVLFVGPFFEEKNLIVMCIGLFVSGSFMGPMMIPNMAEMMFATKMWQS